MEKETNLEALSELRNIIKSISGVKSYDETVKLEYVIVIEDESKRNDVEKVVAVLASQGGKFKVGIEAMVVTEEELTTARQKYAEHLSTQTQFKA